MTTEQARKNDPGQFCLQSDPKRLAEVLSGGLNSFPLLRKLYGTAKGGENMVEGRANANETRQRNFDLRAEAQAKAAEREAQIMDALAQVSKDPDATVEQKLKAAELAVQLHRGY